MKTYICSRKDQCTEVCSHSVIHFDHDNCQKESCDHNKKASCIEVESKAEGDVLI